MIRGTTDSRIVERCLLALEVRAQMGPWNATRPPHLKQSGQAQPRGYKDD